MRLSLLAALLALLLATPLFAEPPVIKNYFAHTDNTLSFTTDTYSIRAQVPRGWTSLKIKDAEFLAPSETAGAILFQKGTTFVTFFPDVNNISHDRLVGRLGTIADNTYSVRITPSPDATSFELYAGYNDPTDQRLVLFLADDVALIRGNANNTERAFSPVITRAAKTLTDLDSAVLVHTSGVALRIQPADLGPSRGKAKIKVGTLKDPAGHDRLAVILDTKGFAANAWTITPEPEVRSENFAQNPAFDVKSSADPTDAGAAFNGAARGAINPVYDPSTKLDFNVEVTWLAARPFTGYAELEVIHALGQPHFYQKVDLKNQTPGPDGKLHIHFDPKFSLPGTSEVWGRLVGEDNRLIWVDRYRMAWNIEAYQPKILVQPDFQAFWNQTLQELRAQPLDPQTTRVEKFADHPAFEIYEVSFNNLPLPAAASQDAGNAKREIPRIYAMLFVPKNAPRPLPVIVTAHPGTTGFGINKGPDGVYGSQLRYNPRFATIVPLIRGHKPDAPNIPFNPPWWGPYDSRETYLARSWYSSLVRTIDYLATRPELFDMKRIVAQGGSQGGAFSLVTAALDPRVSYCFADCPSNCQPQEIIEHYPCFGPSAAQVPPGQTLQDLEKTASYFNPVNFCPLIKCPTYVGSNIGDLTVHSMGPLAAYKNLTAVPPDQKAFYPGFTHAHGSGPGLYAKMMETFDRIAPPPPK